MGLEFSLEKLGLFSLCHHFPSTGARDCGGSVDPGPRRPSDWIPAAAISPHFHHAAPGAQCPWTCPRNHQLPDTHCLLVGIHFFFMPPTVWRMENVLLVHMVFAQNLLIALICSNTFHILRPTKAPGFVYAWLELISHRIFIARMLAHTPQQKVFKKTHSMNDWN